VGPFEVKGRASLVRDRERKRPLGHNDVACDLYQGCQMQKNCMAQLGHKKF